MNGFGFPFFTKSGRRNSYVETISCESKEESTVLVIYSGGTIGMLTNETGALAPAANSLGRLLRRSPFLHDEDYARKRFGDAAAASGNTPFVLPATKEKRRVLYSLIEYDPLLDSSCMTAEEWTCIAEDIKKYYESFDGFVVLHGTDTLAYSASALSFMLEDLGKTVVVTGSQLSLFEARSDAKDNFLESLIIAGLYVIPEVTICFGRKLFRGNRTTKMDAEGFRAFESPNALPLANFGIDIEVNYRELFRSMHIDKFKVHSKLNSNVALLRLFPSITLQTVHAFLQPPIEGIVLQTYGSGNMPSNRKDILDELAEAIQHGVIIVNCSQCIRGTVSNAYQTGKVLYDIGVTSGADMTPEAALTKLSYVLSKEEWDLETKRKMLGINLRGELTVTEPTPSLMQGNRRMAIPIGQGLELDHFSRTCVLFPALMSAAAANDDPHRINNLLSCGADISQPNIDRRTALHVACCEGNLETVKYMLEKGASVHTKDRYDHTPLIDAVLHDRHDIIDLLISCGAHLTIPPKVLGEKLCKAATRGDVNRLQSYQLAGANISETDYAGRTALHVAAMHGFKDCVQFLLKQKDVKNDAVDMLGFTPRDYSIRVNNKEIVSFFDNLIIQ